MLPAAVLLGGGCGGDGGSLDRVAVSGRVVRDAEPLTSGVISFLPRDGHRGPAANAPIRDGRYRFTEETGPVAGPHRVVIRYNASKSDAMQQPAGGGSSKESSSSGPRRWEFEVSVPAAETFEKDFTLR